MPFPQLRLALGIIIKFADDIAIFTDCVCGKTAESGDKVVGDA